MMVAILILNWNSFADTIECIKSLLTISDTEFFIVLGDNGSIDGSLSEFEKFFNNNSIYYRHESFDKANFENSPIASNTVLLCDLQENNGFSKGNNLLFRIASQYQPDYYLCLNNDTVVCSDFLSKLMTFQKIHPEYKVLTPLIYYYYNQDKIWNAGGKLKFGFRKYHYADCENVNFRKGQFLQCTFITGCALWMPASLLQDNNDIFTEKFFFGEEDFEFSMRQNRLGNKMACVCDSVIYHKVSASSKNQSSINKVFIYYLNRFVDMKMVYSRFSYMLWKCIYIPYVYLLLSRHYTLSRSSRFVSLLLKESDRLDSVDQAYFIKTMSSEDLC